MTICYVCECPIKDGDHVRVNVNAVYHQQTDIIHGLEVYQEESVRHLICRGTN